LTGIYTIISVLEDYFMKLTCSGTKKLPSYYVQKSVHIGNKTTTKTVERL